MGGLDGFVRVVMRDFDGFRVFSVGEDGDKRKSTGCWMREALLEFFESRLLRNAFINPSYSPGTKLFSFGSIVKFSGKK